MITLHVLLWCKGLFNPALPKEKVKITYRKEV